MRAELRSGANAGFVLVTVLSVTAFLALMLGGLFLVVRGAAETSVLESAAVREEALITAGVELAGHQLFGLRLSAGAIDGQQVRLDDGTLTIFAVAESGRADLNGSDTPLLSAAYAASGLTTLSPDDFASRVVAWRGSPVEGDIARPARFRSIGDLAWVGEVSEQEIAVLEPFVTVFNPSGRIDPVAAPRALLQSLPGLSAENVDRVMQLRGTREREELFVLRSIFGGLETLLLLGEESRAYAVRVEARLDGGRGVRVVRTVLVAPLTFSHAYHVADWRDGG